MNKDVLRFKKLSGLITESEYKKLLKENEVLNSPAMQNLEKKAFDFFNSPNVIAMVKKAIKLPQQQTQQPVQENQMQVDGFQSFSNFFDKAMQNQTMEENVDNGENTNNEENINKANEQIAKQISKLMASLGGTSATLFSAGIKYVDGSMLRNLISDFYDYMSDSVVNVIDPSLGGAQSIINGLIAAGVAYILTKKMSKL
jgi:sorbitol-specific phosphotransferase system component IIBC